MESCDRYDYVVVGSGLFGSTFAHQMSQAGKKVLVVEKRSHVGGNVYTEEREGIICHKYGPHIFHCNDHNIWDYVNSLTKFYHYTYSPIANFKGRLFNLPFNMNTFHQLWNVKTPAEAKRIIDEQRGPHKCNGPVDGDKFNMEEMCLRLLGEDLYKYIIRDYTTKQWGCSPDKLPGWLIKRLPIRYTFDNNYFDDCFQGIPQHGYTDLIKKQLEGCEVITNQDFFRMREDFEKVADKILYTGSLDEFYAYRCGVLEYRSLEFDEVFLETDNYQGTAVMTHTGDAPLYTRTIEHKHFASRNLDKRGTVVTFEYPYPWEIGRERYYPINDERNQRIFKLYEILSRQETQYLFGGRLAEYRYYDMHQVIGGAMKMARTELKAALER
jgi:UDP-galactopyranose mutase